MGGHKKGKFEIKFKDGGHYSIVDPKMIIHHIIAGTKNQIYYGHAFIRDHVNNMEADIHYNPWSDGSYTGMVKKGWGGLARKLTVGKKKPLEEKNADDVHIKIYMK